ncbi:cytochrome c oxidase subunit II [Geomesophilobacter sediminis]|uniref:Cytochrome c oxidase subunit 2 n=1 Tax=Geomesophilobacter sediminis TaxID=2798584 RepID=A0A8J7JDZ2_9BACT|nr:cytochrome c oxidase subunit II [Geomesophilobacter sediminis]MBJ6724029.1 cytochrome c oxidase subunit II [Geomesophilobacter sediminis]
MPDVYPLTSGDATLIAHSVDGVFIFILAIASFFFLLTQGFLIYFALKYRRRKGIEQPTPYITGNTVLEIVWVIIPSLLLVAIFGYGMVVFLRMRTPIPGAMEVQVTASQFQWSFKYPDGRTALNELRLPVGKPVKLIMTSKDVIHGFFVPAYRQKQDVLPGRYTYLWFLPRQAGSFDLYCSQYCGTGHSIMRGKILVMPVADYQAWEEREEQKQKGAAASPVEKGEKLFQDSGCLGCHSIDGTPKVGPTLKGIFGSTVVLDNGKTLTADEEYLRESIVDPNAKIVKGYQPVMPTFKATLKDDDVAAIIAYLKTLK